MRLTLLRLKCVLLPIFFKISTNSNKLLKKTKLNAYKVNYTYQIQISSIQKLATLL